MRKAEMYRANAHKCREMAKAALHPEHKKTLEDMAQTWDRMAVEADKSEPPQSN
jgi:hypothetical protein